MAERMLHFDKKGHVLSVFRRVIPGTEMVLTRVCTLNVQVRSAHRNPVDLGLEDLVADLCT
jgi:hypothetical protein